MKKYLKLSTNEAIRHFLLKDNTLAPETSEELRQKVKDLDELKSDISVTVIMPTHKSKPDYEMDRIVIKNLVDKASKQLLKDLDKRKAEIITENMEEARETVDNSLNLDCLVMYANEYFSSVVKLPVPAVEEILIGKYFDLRPLYKMRQQNRRYYVLTVSKQKLRLIEGFNDKAVKEFGSGDFPFDRDWYYTLSPKKTSQDSFVDNMEKEFYNDADKSFQKIYNDNPLPLVLAGDVKSVAYFEEVMDDKSMVIARVAGSYDLSPVHEIIAAVVPEIEKYRKSVEDGYLAQINAAVGAGLLVTDVGDIIRLSRESMANMLFIGDNYSIPDEVKRRVEVDDENGQDLLPGLLSDVSGNSGKVVFMDDSLLEKYNGLAMVKRY